MHTRIFHLRRLFESHVAAFTRTLASDPPQELVESVDATMRSLKAFLFAFEGMVRKDNLRGVPFTAREQIYAQAEYAIEILEALHDAPNARQVYEALQPIDALHALCLQMGLMASDLDANRMRQIALNLQKSLSEALGEIDGITDKARGHAERIEQTAEQRVAELNEAYDKQTGALGELASETTGALQSQAEQIRQQQAEARKAIAAFSDELARTRDRHDQRLREHAEAAERIVQQARQQHEQLDAMLNDTREQLAAAREATGTIERMKASVDTAEQDLRRRIDQAEQARKELEGHIQGAADQGRQISDLLEQVSAARQRVSDVHAQLDAALAQFDERKTGALEQFTEAQAALGEMRREATTRLEQWAASAEDTIKAIQQRRDESAELFDRLTNELHEQRDRAREVGDEVERLRTTVADGGQSIADQLEQTRGMLERITAHEQQSGELHERITESLRQAEQTRQRLEVIEAEQSTRAEQAETRHEQALASLEQAVESLEQARTEHHKTTEEQRAAVKTQLDTIAGERDTVVELRQNAESQVQAIGKSAHDAVRSQQEATAGAIEIERQRAQVDQSAQQLYATVSAADAAAQQVRELQSRASECVDTMRDEGRQMEQLRSEASAHIEQVRDEARTAVDQLRDQARDRIAEHQQRVDALTEANERTRRELEEMFGQLTDGGLSQPYQVLAANLQQQRRRWLWLMVGAAGGAAVLVGAILPLLAGTVGGVALVFLAMLASAPLWALTVFCGMQYLRERELEASYQHRGAVARGLGPYRRLLADLHAKGKADSPLIDRVVTDILREPSAADRTGQSAESHDASKPREPAARP